jgi:hypothetical protein
MGKIDTLMNSKALLLSGILFTCLYSICCAQNKSTLENTNPNKPPQMAAIRPKDGTYLCRWGRVLTPYGYHAVPVNTPVHGTLTRTQVRIFKKAKTEVLYMDTLSSYFFQKYRSAQLDVYHDKSIIVYKSDTGGVSANMYEAIRDIGGDAFILYMQRNAISGTGKTYNVEDTLLYRVKRK